MTAIFPALPGLAWSVTKAPRFQTRIQRAVSGRELRVLDQPWPVWTWTLTYALLRDKWDARGEPRDVITVHRPIEKDPLFLEIVDHPAVLPILQQLVGEAPILIDNDGELTPHHDHRKGWHREPYRPRHERFLRRL